MTVLTLTTVNAKLCQCSWICADCHTNEPSSPALQSGWRFYYRLDPSCGPEWPGFEAVLGVCAFSLPYTLFLDLEERDLIITQAFICEATYEWRRRSSGTHVLTHSPLLPSLPFLPSSLVSRKIYWTDGSTINMANMDGSSRKVLHQNQRDPVGKYFASSVPLYCCFICLFIYFYK